MINKLIINHFLHSNLDIRKSGLGTFMDQKVTPDVVAGVTECIIEYLEENEEPFTINDIRYLKYSNHLVTEVFNKPEVIKAANEYDKFFSQPIKMLSYANVLEENMDSRPYKYKVKNLELLRYIAIRERNALTFLQFYLNKLLIDSGIKQIFDSFFDSQNQHNYQQMKDGFIDFVIRYTPKNSRVDVSRIFTKVINPLANQLKKRGSTVGRISNNAITRNELMYNKPNWRDINKDKTLTRVEAKSQFEEIVDNKGYFKYQVSKAKKFVKQLHQYSEVHRFDNYLGLQAHHIFMESEFPEIADLPENIIVLTPNQHFLRAHPNNKTSTLDDAYQSICLISKLDSIEINYRAGENDYSLDDFIQVLNTGFETNEFRFDMSFEEIKHRIIRKYIR
jgi:hypothetical protein